jgi:hypothetical protein
MTDKNDSSDRVGDLDAPSGEESTDSESQTSAASSLDDVLLDDIGNDDPDEETMRRKAHDRSRNRKTASAPSEARPGSKTERQQVTVATAEYANPHDETAAGEAEPRTRPNSRITR